MRFCVSVSLSVMACNGGADVGELALNFELSDEQQAIYDMAKSFGRDEIEPHAVDWDQARHFPVDVSRKTAQLGLAGIYTREEHGGSGVSRWDATLVFEALSEACPSPKGLIAFAIVS